MEPWRRPTPAIARSPRPSHRPRCDSPSAGLRSASQQLESSDRAAASGVARAWTSACTVNVGTLSAPPNQTDIPDRIRKSRSGSAAPCGRSGAAVAGRAELTERDALFVIRPRDDVDEIDAVAHLRDRRSRRHRVQNPSQRLRTQPQKPGLLLIDVDAHLDGTVRSNRS